jgi:hypothetical protein
MEYKIGLKQIEDTISKTNFANDGDNSERNYWMLFKSRFLNCETFWRYFVVPATKRIELGIQDPKERIRPRDGVSEDIKDVASFHYSMFLNLIYAYDHLQNFKLSSFEDFYIHLGSACDLAEDFLLKIYLLVLECTDQKSVILQKLKREDFLKLAEKWYNSHYSKVYEHYLKKGKSAQIKLPSVENILDEYFKGDRGWRQYKRFSQMIREYRNVVVHDVQIGKIIDFEGNPIVPKKERIQHYRKWSNVFAVLGDKQKLKNDFVNMKEQMDSDIAELETNLNILWSKPINDMQKLFFEDKNKVLLKRYNIDLL